MWLDAGSGIYIYILCVCVCVFVCVCVCLCVFMQQTSHCSSVESELPNKQTIKWRENEALIIAVQSCFQVWFAVHESKPRLFHMLWCSSSCSKQIVVPAPDINQPLRPCFVWCIFPSLYVNLWKRTGEAPSVNYTAASHFLTSRVIRWEGKHFCDLEIKRHSSVSHQLPYWTTSEGGGRCRRGDSAHRCMSAVLLLGCTDRSDSSAALQGPTLRLGSVMSWGRSGPCVREKSEKRQCLVVCERAGKKGLSGQDTNRNISFELCNFTSAEAEGVLYSASCFVNIYVKILTVVWKTNLIVCFIFEGIRGMWDIQVNKNNNSSLGTSAGSSKQSNTVSWSIQCI